MIEMLLSLDRDLFFWINVGWSNSFLDNTCYWFTHLGGETAGYLFLLLVIILTRSGWPFLFAGLSYALNAAVFKGIKYSVMRFRPHELAGAILRQDPGMSGATDPSFPSGHTAIAFMIATFLSARYPKWSILFYFLACLIGITRIYLGLHYPSDVIVGAIIGVLTTSVVIWIGKKSGKLEKWL